GEVPRGRLWSEHRLWGKEKRKRSVLVLTLSKNQRGKQSQYGIIGDNATINIAPEKRSLSDAQVRTLVKKGKLEGCKVAIITAGRPNNLTNQIIDVLKELQCEVQVPSIGMAPIPPGITLVGDPENSVVKAIDAAFSEAKIEHELAPGGYAGPLTFQ